ncbi:Ubiquitin conjugation factor E4 B-like 3, partial [Homarus americanus]
LCVTSPNNRVSQHRVTEIRKKRLARLGAGSSNSNNGDTSQILVPQSPQSLQLSTSPPASALLPSPSKRQPPPSPLDITPCKKGIEPMEVDSKDELTADIENSSHYRSDNKRHRSVSTSEVTEEMMWATLSNLLHCSWQGVDNICSVTVQVTPGAKMNEVISQVLMDITLQICAGEVLDGLVDPNINLSQSPELSASPTEKQLPSHVDVTGGSYLTKCAVPAPSLLLHPLLTESLPRGFLCDLIHHTSESQAVFTKVFGPLLQGLSSAMRSCSVTSRTYTRVFESLDMLTEIKVINSSSRPICSLMVSMSNWCPKSESQTVGREILFATLLGPFLGLSLFAEDDPRVVDKFVKHQSNGRTVPDGLQDLARELDHMRTTILHKLFHSILVNTNSREPVLLYLAKVIRYNERRAQIHVEERLVAGDGPMINLLSVLQQLCFKVKLDKVDPYYMVHPDSLVDVSKDSRLTLTQDEVEEWVKKLRSGENFTFQEVNFHSQCWFLTLHAHHLGVLPVMRKYTRRIRAIRDLQKMKLNKSKLCADAGLLDENLLERCIHFYAGVAQIILRALTGGPTTLAPLGVSLADTATILPLPPDLPELFAALPEWYLDDMAEFLLFTLQYVPKVPLKHLEDPIITMAIVLLCSPSHIKNPYLTAKLVEMLFMLTPSVQQHVDTLHQRILHHPLAVHLPVALMKFYTMVESTGASSEFYDKFTIRYHISVIFKSLWEDRRHREALITESNTGKEFVKFVNLLMNDTTFLLDESLDALKVQEEMERGTWATQTREQQQRRQRLLATDERQCRSYLTLARETVDMMHYLTKEVTAPFLRPELCDRLAAMLNFNLAQLCGEKCGNLKVRQADKYGWEPRKLLEQLVDIYLHLDSDRFYESIANDEVSAKDKISSEYLLN